MAVPADANLDWGRRVTCLPFFESHGWHGDINMITRVCKQRP